eukprot:TRINITY_DN14891_c0_g1_i3.p1 TRINITY_DN14891_c0_g1~~TRINITY_DN14891_c0_g1_i3.p1  ORF type:complete len:123 (-),score=39.35 TRINITY_DN14891_c0_g1_i3:111-458(-)
MIRRPPRSTHCISSAASDVYKRQHTDVLIIIYDVTDLKSFTQLDSWLTEGRKLAGVETPVWVVGSKIDSTEKRVVATAAAKDWASAKKCHGYFEVSAATGEGIIELFADIVIKLV